jgi:hypothetical protein
LGIGDTTPENTLTVVETQGNTAVIKARTTAINGRAAYQIGNDADNWFMGIDGGNSDAFFISDAADSSDRLVITGSGNVGIGTDSPSRKLHIAGSHIRVDDGYGLEGSGSTDKFVINNNYLTMFTASVERMRIDSLGSVGIGTISPFNTRPGSLTVSNTAPTVYFEDTNSGSYGVGSFLFQEGYLSWTAGSRSGTGTSGSSEFFRIDASGNVGIGLTAPTTRLHVFKNASGEQTVANFAAHNYGDAAATYIQIGTEYTDGSSRIGSINNGDGGGGNTSALVFETMNTVGGSFTERMRIRHDGRVNIPNAYTETTGNSANLFVDTDGRLIRATSSERYKNTITDATHGLNELLTLRPVTYKGNNDGDTVFGGLIAEEVHDAGLTEFVTYNDDGQPDALAYGNMVSLCIKAIQELKTELDEAKARIVALETA